MVRNNAFVILVPSLICLLTGLAFFDFTVAGPRYSKNQIAHFHSNSPILHFHGRVHRIELDGTVFVRDSAGAIIKTNLKERRLQVNQIVVINGETTSRDLLLVSQVEAYPLRFWKFFLSILGLLFVIWNMIRSLELTPNGLRLQNLNKKFP